MGKSAKVAISLSEQNLKALEKERKVREKSGSQFFRRAGEELLRQEVVNLDTTATIARTSLGYGISTLSFAKQTAVEAALHSALD
jgi:hypothetical protein